LGKTLLFGGILNAWAFFGGGWQQFELLLLYFTIFLHFDLKKQLLRISKFQNQPDVDVLDFQIEL
jgi:hypothetical protein